jgi:YNFM family putative membrane transporter
MVPLVIGMGLFPLLPLYAAQFGATRTLVGVYYAVVYLASAIGVFLTSWLAARIPTKRLFAAGSLLGIPTLALLGAATALWQVVLLTAIVWFCGAITLTLLSVFTGLVSDGASRGRSFSLMFLAYPLGAIVGGTAAGQLVAWLGYGPMFAVLAAVWTIQPLTGLLLLRDPRLSGLTTQAASADRPAPLGRSFALLLTSALLALVAINVGRLGTSLSMQALGFAPGAIASTATVSGLATIPATLLIGVLSDRLGRRHSLTLSYLLAASGAGTLLVATQLWHFWLAATLLFAAWSASRSVASALATDMLPRAALGRGLPRLNAMDSVASILGFAGAGYTLDTLGSTSLYLTAIVLAVLAAQILGLLAGRRRPQSPEARTAPSSPALVDEAAQREGMF